MDKLTGIHSSDLAKQDDRTLLLIIAIRQAKAKQESIWLKKITTRSAAIIAVLQVINIALTIFKDALK